VTYEPQFHVVLHQPEIPQNTGNVGRTCVAAGAKLWLVRPLGFRMDDASLRRAGLDYWPALNWEVADDWGGLESQLAGRRFWYFSKTASRSYEEIQFAEDDVFVFGCETHGLPRSMLDAHSDAALRIPIRDAVRSLNLGNAVAVVLFEALRQQRASGR
jgi:tRNA (cytidine/uridine-2'-O-)-methyltransferase